MLVKTLLVVGWCSKTFYLLSFGFKSGKPDSSKFLGLCELPPSMPDPRL